MSGRPIEDWDKDAEMDGKCKECLYHNGCLESPANVRGCFNQGRVSFQEAEQK